MQFKGKLKNQICENGKKPNMGPDVGSFGPNLLPSQFFFEGFTSTSIFLQAIIIFIFTENLWSKLKKMTKNLILGLI